MNLDLWNRVEKTDPKHTKKANVRGNKITSIKPQYQIYNATKEWGSYGGSWGFRNVRINYELKDIGLIVYEAEFFYPNGKFDVINSISIWRDNARTKLDDEFAKKLETDTLTKCLSKLGFNADVFMGRYDDVRYIEEITKEFQEKQKLTDEGFNYLMVSGSQLDIETALEKRSTTEKQSIELVNRLNSLKDGKK